MFMRPKVACFLLLKLMLCFSFDSETNMTARQYENIEMAVNLESLIPATRSLGYTDMSGQPLLRDNSAERAHAYEEILDQPEYEIPN